MAFDTSNMISKYPVKNLFDIPIYAMTYEQVLNEIHNAIEDRKSLNIGVVNAAKIVNMSRDPLLREDVLSSDLVLADGIAVVWASRFLGRPLPERVAGIDLFYGMLDRGNQYHYRVFCLGATEEVSEQVENYIVKQYPNVILVGRRNGYFAAEEEEEIAKNIAKLKPDILFVAMTSPKKENFMARWKDVMQVTIVHGVGGSFDVMAGKVERAPEIWQKMGLEWLYRVKQEPGRLWKRYLVTNCLFCWLVAKAFILNLMPKNSKA